MLHTTAAPTCGRDLADTSVTLTVFYDIFPLLACGLQQQNMICALSFARKGILSNKGFTITYITVSFARQVEK